MKTQLPYSSAFETAFQHLLVLEGGYVNDATDQGGETKYGISKRTFPDLDIASLTKAQAKAIYWKHYWCAHQCDKFPQPIAFALFDAVVNHRPRTAKRLLQASLGVNTDGIFGPVTFSAATKADGKATVGRYLAARANLYHQIIQANSSQAKFAVGWFKRLFKLQQHIMEVCWPWLP